jgi:hypothetical protein
MGIKVLLLKTAQSLLLRFGGWVPDRIYLRWMFRLKTGRKLDLEHPATFCEKLQWLKLYDRRPEYTGMVDKYAVKGLVARIIGEEHVIPTLGAWDRPEDIAWERLPRQFVLKTTHGGGGGGVVICRDKSALDRSGAVRKLRKSYRESIYRSYREWPYKAVRKRVIAEAYLSEPDSEGLKDYKFYCFNGEPKVLLLASDRFADRRFDYYDMDFTLLPVRSILSRPSGKPFAKPEKFEEMKSIARRLSGGIPYVRVDLYYVNGNVYFGELTFYDASGYDNKSSEEVDLEWGGWIRLPE